MLVCTLQDFTELQAWNEMAFTGVYDVLLTSLIELKIKMKRLSFVPKQLAELLGSFTGTHAF